MANKPNMVVLNAGTKDEIADLERARAIREDINTRKTLKAQMDAVEASIKTGFKTLTETCEEVNEVDKDGAHGFNVMDGEAEELLFKAGKKRAEATIHFESALQRIMVNAGVTPAKVKSTMETLEKAGLLGGLKFHTEGLTEGQRLTVKAFTSTADTGSRSLTT